MIEEATSTRSPLILSATGFARENISIVHQQRRATNLAWALSRRGRVKAGSVVGVVGASFSGLMLATIIAMVDDAIVYVFEREKDILPRFRDKAHRHLSPVLNSRALGKGFDPEYSPAEYRSPIFAWRSGRASDVAAAWAAEFAQLSERLPIFVFGGTEVRGEMLHPRHDGVDIDFSLDEPNRACVSVDLLIDATGYGEEGNPLGLTDFSYWESGHRLIYEHLAPPAKVLISGCGDSGVIEALHYALDGFQHSLIVALWPTGSGLEAQIDLGLERARLDALLASSEPENYEKEVLSELAWWFQQRWMKANNPTIPWPPKSDAWAVSILERLDEIMEPHYRARGDALPFEAADPELLEEIIEELPLEVQLDIREDLRALADEWISREMANFADTIPLPDNFLIMEKLARPGFEIVLNGLTPTAYTRQLSPFNVWVMRLLLALPSVSYQQGEIVSVFPRSDKRFDVTFSDGSIGIFDRVVSRYGPGRRSSGPIAEGRRRNTQEGDQLLSYELSPRDDIRDPSRRRLVDPPRYAVVEGLNKLDARTSAAAQISKRILIARILLGDVGSYDDEPMYQHGADWLSNELRAGRHPRYDADLDLDRHMARN